jgi:hypothetical protein
MGSGVRLGGLGPWTLIEVADALGLSYDTVCRDVRRGVLPAHRAPVHAGSRYQVTLEELGRGGRSAYRQAAAELAAGQDRTAG